jgi:hypothetical protein
MKEKIQLEEAKSHVGRSINQLFERRGLGNNPHLLQEKFGFFQSLSDSFEQEVRLAFPE